MSKTINCVGNVWCVYFAGDENEGPGICFKPKSDEYLIFDARNAEEMAYRALDDFLENSKISYGPDDICVKQITGFVIKE